MDERNRCPRCGADAGGMVGAMCPACLLGLVIADVPGFDGNGSSFEEAVYRDHQLAVIGPVDEGGVGIVYEAEQLSLGRLVALKVLREEHRDNIALRQRFEDEARIGSRLQHPGIIPVYESGVLGDRPFFTMRRVEGRSLAGLLAEQPPLARTLSVFLQVCQTLAYAHDRGVIHLDLKPANVMVGDFGEVVLIDWGMAREDESGPGANAMPPILAWDGGGEAPSGSGSGPVMGTPAYMAPEQARGETDRLDERCDVFGLGAMLCEILTGRPPYTGRTDDEVRRKSREADTADTLKRLDAAQVDEELRALARACLQADPARRPANAGEVAETVLTYQAGVEARLQSAEQARWRAEGRVTEERKRWRATLALVIVCALAGLWYARYRFDRARIERDRERVIERMLDEGDQLRASGRSAEARATALAVEGLLPEADAAVRGRVATRIADVNTLVQVEEARLTPGRAGEPRNLGSRATAYAEAFRRRGINPSRQPASETARLVSSLSIRDALVVALDEWARSTRDADLKTRLRAAAAAADAHPGGVQARLRNALAARDRAALVAISRSSDLEKQPPPVLVTLGATLRQAGARAEAVAVLRDAQRLHPSDFWVNLELAVSLATLAPPAADADAYLTAALALSRRNPHVFLYLGESYYEAERPALASEAYRNALAIKPDYPEALCNLGNSLTSERKLDEAVATFRKAIALRENYDLAYFNLGFALDEQEKYEEAAAAYRQAVAARPDYAEAYCNLGFAEYRGGSFKAAVADLEHGIAMLPTSEPLIPSWQRILAMGKSLAAVEPRLDVALAGSGQPAESGDLVVFARLCAWRNRKLYAHAARFYADAFAASPALADDLVVGDRYAAAESAAMVGLGKGADAAGLSDAERATWRRHALEWLRADLTLRQKSMIGAPPSAVADARNRLRYWLRDPNLEGVRLSAALAALPDNERLSWQALWADHARLIASPATAAPR
jgi:eukaryotic-like serine/threonine-protein kinase